MHFLFLKNMHKNFLPNKREIPFRFATVLSLLLVKTAISERVSATVKPVLQTVRLDRVSASLMQPKPVCATIYLETEVQPAIKLYQDELVNRTEFDNIRVDKLKNARFSVGKTRVDLKNCRLEVCGFSESKDDWGDCEYFRGNVTAPDEIFGNDYEVTSVTCSCNPDSLKDTCRSSICIRKFELHTWKTSECAVLYQETGCQSCYFLPITMNNNTNFNTSNSYQIHSAIVRPNCLLRKTYTGFHWWDDYPGEMNFTNIGDDLLPVFHKDAEHFYCICPPENELSTTTTLSAISSTVLSTLQDSTSFTETTETADMRNNKRTTILAISIAVPVTGIVIFGLLIVYFTRKFKKPKPRSNSGIISIIDKIEAPDDSSEITEPRLRYIADEIQKLAKHFITSDQIKTNFYTQDITANLTVQCSQARSKFDLIYNRFTSICEPDRIIPRNAFTIVDSENPLGSGEFGIVYKGLLHNEEDGLAVQAAVKKIKWLGAHEYLVESFIRELNTYQSVETGHKRIVGFLGACCHFDGLYLLTEYCDGGSLRQMLISEYRPKYHQTDTYTIEIPELTRNIEGSYFVVDANADQEWLSKKKRYGETKTLDDDDLYQLLLWCEQIASGMEFLSSKRIVHVDLAARNILLSSDKSVKICDLGLSRKCLGEASGAKSLILGQFPFHSYAPELISNGTNRQIQVTLCVDIWAYGCTLWELFSLGSSLYPSVTEVGPERILKIRELILQGYRHPNPDLAPDFVYGKMLECWNEIPRDRPSFKSLQEFFKAKCEKCK